MRLSYGLHLAYCTNIHRGEDWTQTFQSLQRDTLAVRARVSPDAPYAIGLRLSDQASRELAEPAVLEGFRQWLDENNCYVFTINGFPFGRFHGARVKEQVYAPDWSQPERLEYTKRLFDLISALVPDGVDGSVSTLPGSFKEFIREPAQLAAIRKNLWECVDYIADLSARTGKKLHLGLEPEPLGLFENSAETVQFFEQMRGDRAYDPNLARHLGVNYDTCHFAVEFEEPADAVRHLQQHGIRISKLHLSSALKVQPTPEGRAALQAFEDDIYLHQVVVRAADQTLVRYRDLAPALAEPIRAGEEWRVHFHVPLHWEGTPVFRPTVDHIEGMLELLRLQPDLCSHLEMETYTWEVLPAALKNRSVVDQLVAEYEWTLQRLASRGFTRENANSAPGVVHG